MARICPCSQELSKRDFIFYFIIIDLFIGLSSIVGSMFAIVALIYYIKDQNFKSAYFKFYAIFSLVVSAFYTVAVFFIGAVHQKMAIDLQEHAILLYIFAILMLPFNLWMIYLSLNMITVTFEDEQEKAAQNDIEATLDQQEEKVVDEEANKKPVQKALEDKVGDDSLKSEVEV